jgi:hypothetical protein
MSLPTAGALGPNAQSTEAYPLNEADSGIHYDCALAAAKTLLVLSRGDSSVVDALCAEEAGIIAAICYTLQAPLLCQNETVEISTNSTPEANSSSTKSSKSGENDSNRSSKKSSSSGSLESGCNLSCGSDHNCSHFDGNSVTSSSTQQTAAKRQMLNRNAFVDSLGGLSHAYVDLIEVLLKILQNVSIEYLALPALGESILLPTLCALLRGPISHRCRVYVLPTLFNLCRLSRARQAAAASQSGLISHLLGLWVDRSHLLQVSVSLFLPVLSLAD